LRGAVRAVDSDVGGCSVASITPAFTLSRMLRVSPRVAQGVARRDDATLSPGLLLDASVCGY
jgi:hypothetical protein